MVRHPDTFSKLTCNLNIAFKQGYLISCTPVASTNHECHSTLPCARAMVWALSTDNCHRFIILQSDYGSIDFSASQVRGDICNVQCVTSHIWVACACVSCLVVCWHSSSRFHHTALIRLKLACPCRSHACMHAGQCEAASSSPICPITPRGLF